MNNYIKPINFGIITGIIWAMFSILIVLIALYQGMDRAYVELDFRLFSGLVLLGGWMLNFEYVFVPFLNYANGYDINLINSSIAALIGFVDGFISGYLIAKIYNLFSIINHKKVYIFAFSCAIIFGICSYLLSVVNIVYSLGYESFDFSVRPISLVLLVFDILGFQPFFIDSYVNFPDSVASSISWFYWGFVDGFIGGMIFIKLMRKIIF